MGEPLRTLEITVVSETAEDLEYLSKKSELSIGEVIDRLTARIVSEDPKIASTLILDDYVLLTSKLKSEDLVAVAYDLIGAIMTSFPAEVMDEIVEKAKKDREKMLENLDNITAAEMEELKGYIKEVLAGLAPGNGDTQRNFLDNGLM